MPDDDPRPDPAEALAHARHALERLRAALGARGGDESGRRIAALASQIEAAVAEEGALAAARENLADAVRRRPFAALAIAFGAGLALALLTRG